MGAAEEEQSFKSATMLRRAEELTTSWAYKPDEVSKDEGLVLLDNAQFIYELALAELELEALGAKFEITNGLRKFKLLEVEDEDVLLKRLAYFRSVNGKATDYYRLIQYNQTRSVNQYLTHWIYPYKGKFHPQMIRALLNFMGLKRGDKVLDPFLGSGTAAVEAQLLGMDFVGVDVSPLCVLQSKVKTESVDVLHEIVDERERVANAAAPVFGDSDGLQRVIDSIANERVRNFYKMARLVSVSDSARRGRDPIKSFLENLEAMVNSVKDYAEARKKLNLKLGPVRLEVGDSRKLSLGKGEVDGIVTSPPYSIALDYVENDAHALKELGYDVEKIRDEFIGVRGARRDRIELYNEDMKRGFSEIQRVLGEGRYATIVIGNATFETKEVQTVQFTIRECEDLGLRLVKNVDKIIFGLYNVMRQEKILIFQKE